MWEARIEFCDGSGDGGEAGVHVFVVLENEFGEAGCEGRERGGVDIMGCHTRVESIYAVQPFGREREVGPCPPFQPGQKERATDIREEADGGLGHGENGALGSYPYRGVHGQPDAAPHRYAIHVGDVGFRVRSYEVVELVLEAEVPLTGRRAFSSGGVLEGEGRDVAAGAESFRPRAADDYHTSQLRLLPFLERSKDAVFSGGHEREGAKRKGFLRFWSGELPLAWMLSCAPLSR